MFNKTLNRREFALCLGKFAFAAVATSTIIGSCKSSAPNAVKTTTGKTVTLDLTDPKYSGLTTVGASINIPDPNNSTRPMIVRRASLTTVVALSSQCTFDGCQLPFPVNGVTTCPCCHSQFDENGTVIGGPATTNLTLYTATLNGSTITIDV
jgi:Rieske Fe-S protein